MAGFENEAKLISSCTAASSFPEKRAQILSRRKDKDEQPVLRRLHFQNRGIAGSMSRLGRFGSSNLEMSVEVSHEWR
jgi:hypothetical protein